MVETVFSDSLLNSDPLKEREEQFLAFLSTQKYDEKCLQQCKRAIVFAKEILADKKRLSKDSFFDHNLRVAQILADNKASPEVLVAALAHATVKYVDPEMLKEELGKDVLRLVLGVEEITAIKSKTAKLEADAIRKVLLATIQDVRIILLKLADKLDNLRDISVLDRSDQVRIAQEILDVYTPLAYRLGVEKIRSQLEDLAFKVLHPKEFGKIVDFLEQSKEEREAVLRNFVSEIKEGLSSLQKLEIKSRPKHLYSIYKKVVQRGISLDLQYDHLGVRILVNSVDDCYSVLGYLHEHFDPIEGRLKDYIANAKPNGYQSLHTGILFEGRRVEVQIRTFEMNEFAEEGLAAHWRYKGLKSDRNFETRMAWLKGVLDLQKDESSREFLESVKVNLFTDEIHCYTPKGDVRYLPKGATVLDFAYSIHLQVGHHTVGARINGRFVSFRTELSSGDVVEVLTSKKQVPRRDWLKFAKTARARQKIRKGIREFHDLPPIKYRVFTPEVDEKYDTLVQSVDNENAACVLAKCCLAVPKDEIVGILTKRRFISVHKQGCREIASREERWREVHWKETFSKKLELFVLAAERSGLLADLLHTIARAQFVVEEAKAKRLGENSECSFVIVPREIDSLVDLLSRLKRVKGVKKVHF